MPVIFQQSQREIRFTVWGTVCQRISAWESSIDEMVFSEQLAIGSFRGKHPIDGELRMLMQQMQAQGRIAPYYGAGGSGGSCVYQLQRAGTGFSIRVENTTAAEAAEFSYEATDQREGMIPHITTWFATKLGVGEVAKPRQVFKINGQELQNLRAWAHWHEQQASTARYAYQFGRVSMGRLGYAVKVLEVQSQQHIDVTDYASW